jgi:hypothetical protein
LIAFRGAREGSCDKDCGFASSWAFFDDLDAMIEVLHALPLLLHVVLLEGQ